MALADRVKDTTLTSGTGTVTLAQSVQTGYQLFGTAFSATSTVSYCIASRTTADWEVGIGTFTPPATLARTPTASSNAGALVNFGAEIKDVFCTTSARVLTSGLVDPNDAGFDIVLCSGQSNMAGRGVLDTLIDAADSRVYQFGCYSGNATYYQNIFSGADPLHMVEAVETSIVGPVTSFARTYASTIPNNRRVLLVPYAQGSTALVFNSPAWASGNPGAALYEGAIAQANAAITKALLTYPNSRFVGTIWIQGEMDADNAITQSAYVTALKALIAGFRARITGATKSWFVIGGMVPEAYPTNGPIPLAHQQVATETDKCQFVAGPTGYNNGVHYTAPGARIIGAKMALAVDAATRYVGTVFPATTITMTGPTTGAISAASAPFTIGANGTISGTVTVTPSDGGGGGTFTPTSVAISAATQTATFTYTPSATPGARTISVTNNGALTNPSNITYTSTSATITVTTPGTQVSGTAFTLAGTYTGFTPTALDYSLDGGTTWTAATTPTISAGNYSFSLTITGANASQTVKVRDHTTTTIVGTSGTFTVSATATYATWNPADKNANLILSNANLTVTSTLGSATTFESIRSTISKTAGKWYWETTINAAGPYLVGVGDASVALNDFTGDTANSVGYYNTGVIYKGAAGIGGTPATFTTGDKIGVALDMGAGTCALYKNNVLQGTATGLTGSQFAMVSSKDASPACAWTTNFGASAFTYTPPTGFVGLA